MTDNVGVASMQFYIDNSGQWVLLGTSTGEGTACTNSVVLDTSTVQSGNHTLLCRPLDAAGNYSFAMLSVTVVDSSCTYTLSLTGGTHGPGTESGSFGVTAAAACSWAAMASQGWIHTTSSGSGNGRVSYTVDANASTSARTGTITVGGQTFTVNQAGITCSYTLSATTASFGSGADSGSFGVTAQAACNWSATPSQT